MCGLRLQVWCACVCSALIFFSHFTFNGKSDSSRSNLHLQFSLFCVLWYRLCLCGCVSDLIRARLYPYEGTVSFNNKEHIQDLERTQWFCIHILFSNMLSLWEIQNKSMKLKLFLPPNGMWTVVGSYTIFKNHGHSNTYTLTGRFVS